MKILLVDIETSPNIGYTWGKYEQNVVEFTKEWHMLSFSCKWLGDKGARVYSLPDYPSYKKDPTNDKALVKELWKYLDEADIVIGHNLDSFDVKMSNIRFLYHGMNAPSSYKTIDTKKVAKRFLRLNSNKLDDIGETFGLGRKVHTGGFALWTGCLAGDKKSWKLMCKYNKQDVILLEKVYLHLRPWMTNHPNLNVLQGTQWACPSCGSEKTQSRGTAMTKNGRRKRYQCQDCGAWSSGKLVDEKSILS